MTTSRETHRFSDKFSLNEEGENLIFRCNKKLKQNHPQINIPTCPTKAAPKEAEWDIFDDWDIYKDIDLYPSQASRKESSTRSNAMFITWKPLQLQICGISSKSLRPQIRFVSNGLLVGKVPGAHIAAVGPENLIVVVSPSSSPVTLIGNRQSPTILAEEEILPAVICGKPSCLLILSHNRYKSHWDGSCLSDQLFNTFCPSTSRIKIDHLLLQGDMDGTVSVFPMQHPDQNLLPSTVLCDLKEPICQLVATTVLDTDALFVISSLGRIAAIAASTKHDNTRSSSLGLLSQPVKLFQVDHEGFVAYDWRVPDPVVSAVMNGSNTLCFCSASDVCIADLLETFNHETMLKSRAHKTEMSQQVTIKTFLQYKTIPIDDVVIAIAGKGSSSSVFNSRSVIALTSRGRLIAVEISDHVLRSQRDVFMPRKLDKSWKPVVKKREANVKELINDIAAIEERTDTLQQMTKHIDNVICELSSALRLCFDVVNCRNHFNLHTPHSSVVPSSLSGLACNLEVHPVVLCISRERLCFGARSSIQIPSDYVDSNEYKFHVKVNLSNHGSYPISSFWVLMLELQCAEKRRTMKKLYFSNIINDGYGIACGASSTIEYDVPCSENYITPMVASVFLCHLHENHSEGLSTINIRIPSVKNMWKPLIKDDFLNPGAVVIPVATFRVDMLSLLRKPKNLQHLSSNKSSYSMTNKITDNGEGSQHFSERFWLIDQQINKLPSWDTLPTAKKWKDYCLEDLVSLCSVSVDGEELTGSDPNGNRVVFTVSRGHRNKNDLRVKGIHIAADSLILGCLIRESVLWRLVNDTDSTQLVVHKKDNTLQHIDHILTTMMDVQRQLGAAMSNMKNVESLRNAKLQMSGSADQFFYLVFDTSKLIIDMYRNYRAEIRSVDFGDRFLKLK